MQWNLLSIWPNKIPSYDLQSESLTLLCRRQIFAWLFVHKYLQTLMLYSENLGETNYILPSIKIEYQPRSDQIN